MKLKLEVQPRTIKGKKVRALRRKGVIPGAISRYKQDTLLVQAKRSEVQKLVGINPTTLVEVYVEGVDNPITALVTEVLRDPLTEELVSFTLTEITPKSKLRVQVPIKLVGESPILKKNLGVLVISKPFVKLVVNSENIVHELEVNLGELESIGDTVAVRDVLQNLPKGVKLASYKEIDDAIVTIVPLQKAVAETSAESSTEAAEEEVSSSEGEQTQVEGQAE